MPFNILNVVSMIVLLFFGINLDLNLGLNSKTKSECLSKDSTLYNIGMSLISRIRKRILSPDI